VYDLQRNSATKAAAVAVGEAARRPTWGPSVEGAAKPLLVFFDSPTSGASRRVEGFLAQVLQHRRNHDTFTLKRVNYEERPDLAARLRVESAPAIVVVEEKLIRARLEQPRGCTQIRSLLAPWLK
jgi:thioredoxin-like negative regulator of GroEL